MMVLKDSYKSNDDTSKQIKDDLKSKIDEHERSNVSKSYDEKELQFIEDIMQTNLDLFKNEVLSQLGTDRKNQSGI